MKTILRFFVIAAIAEVAAVATLGSFALRAANVYKTSPLTLYVATVAVEKDGNVQFFAFVDSAENAAVVGVDVKTFATETRPGWELKSVKVDEVDFELVERVYLSRRPEAQKQAPKP